MRQNVSFNSFILNTYLYEQRVALYSGGGSRRSWGEDWIMHPVRRRSGFAQRRHPVHMHQQHRVHTLQPHTHTCISVLHSVGRPLSSPRLNRAGPTQPICVDLPPSSLPCTSSCYVSISGSLKDYCYRCSVPLLHHWQAAARREHRFEIDAWDLHIPLPGCLCASEVRRSFSTCNSSWAWASEVGSDFDEEKQNAAPLVISEEQTKSFFFATPNLCATTNETVSIKNKTKQKTPR